MVENKRASSSSRSYIPRRKVINRDSIDGYNRLIRDYFGESPVYNQRIFRRRFRMQRELFNRIKDAVEAHEQYFVQRHNATEKLGLSYLQKITAAFRMLAYGITGDLTYEYIRIGESTTIKSSHNDINVLERSPVFDELTQEHAPEVNYTINGHEYDM
ncbi:hypothetical protein LIER_31163 [Lithospermum erythrorhizon]|uniref:Uncharacterized protein n=1 Tax=Lithospermum erythrorhizon TaxID=34254 RepID=A0AAV3RTP9_LITER